MTKKSGKILQIEYTYRLNMTNLLGTISCSLR